MPQKKKSSSLGQSKAVKGARKEIKSTERSSVSKRVFTAAAARKSTGPPRVFAPAFGGRIGGKPITASTAAPRRVLGPPIGHGDFPNAVLQGSTANFNVYYDPSLGADGVTIAKGVLASCEADYNRVKSYFGGITPPGLPFNVIIANLQGGGAYHYGCSAIDIYCDVKTTPSVDPKFTEFLNMAEVVEVFEAAQ